jgi:hypothetical protein
MIGYYPEFFERLTGDIYERAESGPRPGEPWEPGFEADFPANALTERYPPPAPWAVGTPWKADANNLTTAVEVTHNAKDLLDPARFGLEPDWRLVERYFFKPRSRRPTQLPAGAIAACHPWHLWGQHWGIYFSSEALLLFTGALSRITGQSLGRLLLSRSARSSRTSGSISPSRLLRPRSRTCWSGCPIQATSGGDTGFHSNWSEGPVEEIVASWAEVEFASRPHRGFGKLRPKGYRQAVQQLLSVSPPGYDSESEWMDDWDSATEIIAATMSLIADQSIGTVRLTEMSQHETPKFRSTGSVIPR